MHRRALVNQKRRKEVAPFQINHTRVRDVNTCALHTVRYVHTAWQVGRVLKVSCMHPRCVAAEPGTLYGPSHGG